MLYLEYFNKDKKENVDTKLVSNLVKNNSLNLKQVLKDISTNDEKFREQKRKYGKKALAFFSKGK